MGIQGNTTNSAGKRCARAEPKRSAGNDKGEKEGESNVKKKRKKSSSDDKGREEGGTNSKKKRRKIKKSENVRDEEEVDEDAKEGEEGGGREADVEGGGPLRLGTRRVSSNPKTVSG
ncbi:hypothetical protein LTS02_008369 [Friedmanniomyces endolithicus]|nr:hypothetical protein LTS02_008369 [Friedmanniomyces endolithicus]